MAQSTRYKRIGLYSDEAYCRIQVDREREMEPETTPALSQPPEKWLEQRRWETIVQCGRVLANQAEIIPYGKSVEDAEAESQEQKDHAVLFQNIYDDIIKSIPPTSYSTTISAARVRRERRNREEKRGWAQPNYEHERNHVPVLSKKATKDFPSVSKLPALKTSALQGVSKDIEEFINRFPGINKSFWDFGHSAMFSPGPTLLEWSAPYTNFKKLYKNVFVNTDTKTTLVFLAGVEVHRQVDLLFAAAVGAFPGLANRVGMAECVAFYPDLMCAEYDFIGLGLKELLKDSFTDIVDAKIDYINGLEREPLYSYKENLLNRLPFIIVEICNVAQRLTNNGLSIMKAMPNIFAVDITDNDKPVLAILDCLSPLGYNFGITHNNTWSDEIENGKKDVAVQTGEARGNETLSYCIPAHMIYFYAPEVWNSISETTEATTAYAVANILEKIMNMVKYDSSDSTTTSPAKAMLLSSEIQHMIFFMCNEKPEMRFPLSFLSSVVIDFMKNVVSAI